MSSLKKYLSLYAEKEIFSFDDFYREFSHVITIPAFDESIENINVVLDSIQEKNTLAILIVNSQHNSSHQAKKSNADLIEKIKNDFLCTWKSKNNPWITLHETKNCELLLIDRSSEGLELPSKTGVGLARKIASDVALKLISNGNINTTWIHCTDADVILPHDYFISTKDIKGFSAAVYPYFHTTKTDNEINKKSILLYDLSLLHYVNGLHHAKSNYAYHTIGSTIAVDFEAYAKVRGFPTRESGEDFYILNKLSKIGKIKKISGG